MQRLPAAVTRTIVFARAQDSEELFTQRRVEKKKRYFESVMKSNEMALPYQADTRDKRVDLLDRKQTAV